MGKGGSDGNEGDTGSLEEMMEGTMSIKKFKCPKCGCRRAEEVMVNVTESTVIEGIDEDGYVIYGSSFNDGGVIDRYQCQKCGEVILDEQGRKIASSEHFANHVSSMKGKTNNKKRVKK